MGTKTPIHINEKVNIENKCTPIMVKSAVICLMSLSENKSKWVKTQINRLNHQSIRQASYL